MIKFYQEASLPKLSQTSLYVRFNESSNITKTVISEINKAKEYRVSPDDIPEIVALIRLNGDAIAKKAVEAFSKGLIIVLNNKETSEIPASLPFIVISKDGKMNAYIFAEKVVDNINSSTEYTKLMAVMEAAYLALKLNSKPDTFILNRPLVLTFCNLFCDMVTAPLEQKIYAKGENLTKMRLYTMAFFYRMIDGESYDVNTLPSISKHVVLDKVEPSVVKQIGTEVGDLESVDIMSLINLFKKINPVRYKDLDIMYMTYFQNVCGSALIFALENLQYLFLLIASSAYKTGLTGYALNKEVSIGVKKAVSLMSNIV